MVEAPGAAPSRLALFVHGIYGAGRNWSSVARRLARARPEWAVALVDLRSHGRSPGPAPHTVAACAADLVELEERLGHAADAVLGHSFGGKVALLHAARRSDSDRRKGRSPAPDRSRGAARAQGGARRNRRASGQAEANRLPGASRHRQIWVVDSFPGSRRPGGTAWRMLGALRRRSGPFADRAEAVAAVETEGFSPLVARWMATNAVPTDEGWTWRLDPGHMEGFLRDYFAADAWPLVEDPPGGAAAHFVRAAASSVLDDSDAARIRAAGAATGRVFLHEVAGGHWVNAENPGALHELLARHLP